MSVYLVTYDLLAPGRSYQPLYDRLASWQAVRPLSSVWFVDWVGTSAIAIRDDLQKAIDWNDRLFVTRLRRDWAGLLLLSNAANWLSSPLRTWD